MPAPRHFRLTYSGVFGSIASPAEEWSMGLSLIAVPDGTYTVEGLQAAANALQPHWSTHIGAAVSGACFLTRTRMSLIGPDGKTERTAAGQYLHADNMTTYGGMSSHTIPTQIAGVVSLESAYDGPTGRGRFYVPVPAGTVDGSGLWDTTSQAAWRDRAKAFVDAINATVQGQAWGAPDSAYGRVCVASGGSAVKGLAPALHPVERVGYGRVPDTQRRRRNDLLEQKVWADLA